MISNKDPFISIIIPIYNVEKYLRQAVDSVLAQSFRDYELILVDDGSFDRSPALCDEYASLDKRIIVLHKENGGLSDARNYGIQAAKGKYLLFIDGDDFIAQDSLNNLVNTLKQDGETDVVLLNVAYYYDDGEIQYQDTYFKKSKIYGKTQKEALDFLTSLSNFTTSACLKLIKRELIISNHLFFSKVLWCEDTDFSMRLYLYAKTYNYCESYLYYYRKDREGSLTYTFSEEKYKDLINTISKWMIDAKAHTDYIKYSEEIQRYFAFQYCLLLSGYNKINRSAQRKWKKETKKYAFLLDQSKNRQIFLVRIFYHLMGLHFTSYALGLYEKFNYTISKYKRKKEHKKK